MPALSPLEAEVRLLLGPLNQQLRSLQNTLKQVEGSVKSTMQPAQASFDRLYVSSARATKTVGEFANAMKSAIPRSMPGADQINKAIADMALSTGILVPKLLDLSKSFQSTVKSLQTGFTPIQKWKDFTKTMAANVPSVEKFAATMRSAVAGLQTGATAIQPWKSFSADLTRIAKEAVTVNKGVRDIGVSAGNTQSIISTLVSNFGRIAVFSVVAGIIVRGFFEITSAIKNTVAEGIRFNATMEQSKIAIAGLLINTRQFVDNQGNALSIVEAFPPALKEAARIQQDILIANIKTLGTGQELMEVYQQVLAMTGNQVGNLQDVLTASEIILNISRLNNEAGEKAVVNARQLFTLDTERGNTVLRFLQTRLQEAKNLRDQGLLLQEIIKRGEVFLRLSDLISDSWEALVSSAQTFFSQIAGAAFLKTFEGLKDFIRGFGSELAKISAQGGLTAALGTDAATLEAFGRNFAHFTAAFVKNLAEITNALIRFAASSNLDSIVRSLTAIKDIIIFLVARKLFLALAGEVTALAVAFRSLSITPIGAVATAIGLLAVALSELEGQEKEFNSFVKGVTVDIDKLKQELQDILAAEGIEGLQSRIDQFKAIIETLPPDMAALVLETDKWIQTVRSSGEATNFSTESLKILDGAIKIVGNNTNTANTALEKARLSLIEQTKALQIENEELEKAKAGLISYEEALLNAEERQNAIKSGSEEAAHALRMQKEANKELKDPIEEVNEALKDGTKALEEHIERVEEWGKAQLESADAVLRDAEALAEENAIILAGIQVRLPMEEIERQLTIARIDRSIATERAKLEEDGLTQAEEQALAIKREVMVTNLRLSESLDQYAQSSQGAILTTKDFETIITGILQGTQSLVGGIKDLGEAMGARLITGFLFGKQQGEKALLGNFQQLFGGPSGGIVGAILGQGGSTAASSFFSNFIFDFGKAFQNIGSFLSGSASFTGAAQGVASSLGPAGILAAEVFLAGFFAEIAGASTEAKWGAIIGTLLLGPLGGILGGFLGDLFANLPTKGTQVREGVQKWLEDLDVVFAEEIDPHDYGFEFAKQFAENLGDDENVEFVRQGLRAFIGETMPDVADEFQAQLRALGVLITKDLAEEVGKPLQDTTIAFANMIAANLDIEQIGEFIDDLVEKSDIGFEAVVQAGNDAFQAQQIDVELYKEVIDGAIDLFLSDLPEALGIAQIAMESFTEEGIFDLEAFQQKVEDVVKVFAVLGPVIEQSLAEGLRQGLSPADIAQSFIDAFDEAIRTAVITAIVTSLTQGLELGALAPFFNRFEELMEQLGAGDITLEEFGSGMKEALNDAQPAIEDMQAGIEAGAQVGEDLLESLGLMPEAAEEVTEEISQWKEEIDRAIAGMSTLSSVAKLAFGGDISEGGVTLAAQLSDSIESGFAQGVSEAVLSGDVAGAVALLGQNIKVILFNAIFDAFIQAFAAQVLMPLLQPLIASLAVASQAFIDGFISAEQFALETVTTIALLPGILAAVTPIFEEWLKLAEAIAAELGLILIPTTTAATGLASGQNWVAPSEATVEDVVQSIEELEAAVESFASTAEESTSEIQTAIDTYNQIVADTIAAAALVIDLESFGVSLELAAEDIDAFTAALLAAGLDLEEVTAIVDTLQPFIDVIDGAGDALVANIDSVVQEFVEAGDVSSDTAGDVADLIDEYTALIASLEAAAEVSEEAAAMLDEWTAAVDESFSDQLNELIKDLGDSDSAFSGVIEVLKETVSIINQIKAAIDAGDIALEELQGLIRELALITLTELLESLQDVADAFQDVAEEADSAFESITDAVSSIGDVDSAFSDFTDTLKDIESALRVIITAIRETRLTLEDMEGVISKLVRISIQELIEDFHDLRDEIRSTMDDINKSLDDFVEAGQDVSSLQLDLNDLTADYEQALHDLREEQFMLILTGEDVQQMYEDINESFIAQAQALGEALVEDLTAPAQDILDGLDDTFASISLHAAVLASQIESAFSAGDMELVLDLAADTINAQVDLVNKIRDLQSSFSDLLDTIGGDIQGLIEEGMTLQEQVIANNERIAGMIVALSTTAGFEEQLGLIEDIRAAILDQFETQKQLFQESLDFNVAQLEATKDANVALIEAEREARRTELDDTISSLNERIDAHNNALDEIQQLEEDLAQLRIEARAEELQTAIDVIDERISIAEDFSDDVLSIEEMTLEERIRMVEDFRDAAKSIRAAIDKILLSEVSPLTPIQRLSEAQRQFAETLAAARAGDMGAAGSLGDVASQLLGEASAVFASSQPFQDIFNQVITAMEEVGAQFEQDAQLLELENIAEIITLTGEETIEELVDIRETLQAELDSLNETVQDQIDAAEARLAELRGSLETNIDEIITTRDTLQAELDNIDDTFQTKIDEEIAAFDAAVDEQTAAFEQAVTDARNAAIIQLEGMEASTNGILTSLEALEAAAVAELQRIADTVIPTAVSSIVNGMLPPEEAATWWGVDSPLWEAINNPAWVEGWEAALQSMFDAAIDRWMDRFEDLMTHPIPSEPEVITRFDQLLGWLATQLTANADRLQGHVVWLRDQNREDADRLQRHFEFWIPWLGSREEGLFARLATSFNSSLVSRVPSFQGGGIVPAGETGLYTLHGPEAVIPMNNRGSGELVEIDYDRIKEAFVEAMTESRGSTEVVVPIQVITEDGEVLVDRTVRRLADDSASGKVFIHSRAVGRFRRL